MAKTNELYVAILDLFARPKSIEEPPVKQKYNRLEIQTQLLLRLIIKT